MEAFVQKNLPFSRQVFRLFFGKMFVVENVILTVAVIACAAGAVTEFQIGEVHVCPSADGAFVAVAPICLFFLLLPDRGFELDGLVGCLVLCAAPPPCKAVGNGGPEKDEEVQQGDEGQHDA
jgi:hypothetical protein